jgi:3-oxoadipate enol-lactonase
VALAGFREKSRMVDAVIAGQPIRYEDTGGDGPALVFSHAFGMNGSMFAPQVAAFGDRYRCVAWNARGHLGSPASQPFDFWDSGRDLIGLLDHLGIDRAALVGTSQGGFAAMRAALTAPERVAGLILLGSSAAAEAPQQRAVFRQMMDAFGADPAAGPPEEVLDGMAYVCLGAHDATAWKDVWRAWPADQADRAITALIDRDDIVARLGEIKAPALVMHGADDHSYAPDIGRQIAEGLADCRGFEVVDGGAHFLSLTDAAPVNAAMARFLDAIGWR